MLDRIRHGGRRGHPPVKFPHKLVHFDLKGAPLNVSLASIGLVLPSSLWDEMSILLGVMCSILLEHPWNIPWGFPLIADNTPLQVPYIEKVLPLLAKLGATGILIEYEDMFPYDGVLAGIKAGNAYSKDDIRRILEAAKANNLIVIPLVQTFGHLEFVLKLREFKHLREVRDISSSSIHHPRRRSERFSFRNLP